MNFVTAATNEVLANPLMGVVASTLLGSHEFVTFIKENFLSKQKPDKTVPALNELSDKISMQDIFNAVDAVFGNNGSTGRNVKMFLCQRYTDEKLKDIGACFGVGESAVSEASRRAREKMKTDKNLEREIAKIETILYYAAWC